MQLVYAIEQACNVNADQRRWSNDMCPFLVNRSMWVDTTRLVFLSGECCSTGQILIGVMILRR